MKTQLLQDIQESGSEPAPPQPAASAVRPRAAAPVRAPDDTPAPRPRPAVWQGPAAQRAGGGMPMQRADAGAIQRAPDTTARGLGVAIEAWAERAGRSAAEPAAGAPAGESDPPAPSRPHPPPQGMVNEDGQAGTPTPPPRVDPAPRPDRHPADTAIPRFASTATETDWLAARLGAGAAERATPAWNSIWKRRLVTWSIAGGLLAGVAAGGLWLYEENRVDGALGVVAETSPPGVAPTAGSAGAQAYATGTVPAAPAAPVPPAGPADAVKLVPDPVTAPAAPVPAPAPDGGAADGRTVNTVEIDPPRHAPRQATAARARATAKTQRKRTPQEPPAARVAAQPSPRQRREETLMQCRAHGYDERQCRQRGCTMTRYGLACTG